MSDFLDWSTLIYRAPALLIAMALHEYAHAYVSDSLGDPTPSMQGRLTANPLVHLDMVGLMLLVVCGFGWAKPVEINPNYYKNFRSGVMKVSFAGPGMNLLICFLAECIMLLMMKLGLLTAGQPGHLFLYWIMLYNVWFAFFNLIPVPPLDGSKVLMMLLPYRQSVWLERNQRYLSLALWILILVGVLSTPLSYLSNWIMHFFVWATQWIGTLVQMVM